MSLSFYFVPTGVNSVTRCFEVEVLSRTLTFVTIFFEMSRCMNLSRTYCHEVTSSRSYICSQNWLVSDRVMRSWWERTGPGPENNRHHNRPDKFSKISDHFGPVSPWIPRCCSVISVPLIQTCYPLSNDSEACRWEWIEQGWAALYKMTFGLC